MLSIYFLSTLIIYCYPGNIVSFIIIYIFIIGFLEHRQFDFNNLFQAYFFNQPLVDYINF